MRFNKDNMIQNTYNYTPLTEPLNVETVDCIICLADKNEKIQHFSTFNSDCSCNYHIHKSCMVQWVRMKYPDNAACLLCKKELKKSNEIVEIDTRLATENHPLSLYHPNPRNIVVVNHRNHYPGEDDFGYNHTRNLDTCFNTAVKRICCSTILFVVISYAVIHLMLLL